MSEPSRPKIIAGMPAYNEERYISGVILRAKQYAEEVIVVDDGSTDLTARVAQLAGATVIKHDGNQGYGAAIQSLLAEAKKRNPDILVILDADSQHRPEEIPNLIKPLAEGFDVVIGSRKIGEENIPTYRHAGQKVLSSLTRTLSRSTISDTESGFRAYSRKAIAVLKPKETGMAISAEIISEATARGLKITEVPVSAIYTSDGSTLNPIIHGLGVLNRIILMISERRPLLFFGLLGSISILAGLATGVVVVLILRDKQVLQVGTALLSMLLVTVGVLCIFTGIILNTLARRIGSSQEKR